MKVFILSVCAAIFLMITLFACQKTSQNIVLSGHVIDASTGKPIADAVVHERSHGKLRVRTDANGFYRLEGISKEEHTIFVTARGFSTAKKVFPVDASKETQGYAINFKLDRVAQAQR